MTTQPEPEYRITESELQAALIAIAEDDEDQRAIAWFDKIRSRPHNPAPHATPLCNSRCKLYLVGRGCIHQLEYETTGVCRESIRAETRAAAITELLASAGNKCPDTCIYKRFAANMRNAAAHDEQVKKQARYSAIYEILKDFKFTCPGGEITPICDLCGANRYCNELRSEVKKE